MTIIINAWFVPLLCHMLHMYYVPENITKENYGEIFLTIHIATIFLNYLKRKNTLILGSNNMENGQIWIVERGRGDLRKPESVWSG